MPYTVKCWIPIEIEEPEIHKTLRNAQNEYEDCRDTQPENHYEVVEVDEDGVEV